MANGTFLLADISGHSRYLDEAGLRHASNVTARLLNELVAAGRRRWKMANLEGDAVFFVKPEREPIAALMDQVSEMFQRFMGGVLELGQDTDCGCGACAGSNRLALKFIVHSGEYEERRIGGRREVIGRDVVVAHRLLKTKSRVLDYALLSAAYLSGEKPDGFRVVEATAQTDLGEVPYVIADLAPVRRAFEAGHGASAGGTGRLADLSIEIRAPAARVWDALLNPALIKAWSGDEETIYFPARTGNFGSVYVRRPREARTFASVVLALDGDNRKITLRRSEVPVVRRLCLTYALDEANGATVLRCGVGADSELTPRQLSRFASARVAAGIEDELSRLKSFCQSNPRK